MEQYCSGKYPHNDKRFFQKALEQTAAETGFLPSSIEKDYYCSLILREIFTDTSHCLVFKGGTLLNKTYVGFYRMSEDLDFSISASANLTRTQRSNLIQPIKKLIANIETKVDGLDLIEALTSYNNSTQYNSCFQYQSSLSDNPGKILFEIGLREEILISPVNAYANTLIKNPLTDSVLIKPHLIRCLTKNEAYAEKLRAALTRKKPAIRDLFDLDYAIHTHIVDMKDPSFQDLVKTKLAKPQILKIDLSNNKKNILQAQIQSELRPVLRRRDFEQFNFNKAWSQLLDIYKELLSQSKS